MKLDFYPNEIIEGNFVSLRIEAVGGDLDRVVCKYPRSFMDEMARQLTEEIETALGVKGLADSSVQLVMAFAPNTYLEHICENVTYRRLMLLDKVSAPRDFWIKWTRLAGEISEYSADNIRFELGEDVDQKIREKEYRYLLSSGAEGYHNSMGRKKVTEWREVVKRAAKRGELTKIESDLELSPEIYEIEARIANLLGKKIEQGTETSEEISYAHSDENEFESALAKMRQVVEEKEIGDAEPETEELFLDVTEQISKPEQTDEEVVFEEIEQTEEHIHEEIQPIIEESLSLFDAVDEDDSEEIFDQPFDEEITEAENEPEVEEIEEVEETEEIEETEELEETEETEELEEIEEIEVIEEEAIEEEAVEEESVEEESAEEELAEEIATVEETPIPTPVADRAAYIRAEIEAKIRLEYESKARIKAEEDLIALKCEFQSYKVESEAILLETKRELEMLRLEYHGFLQETKRREMQRRADEAQRIAEEQALRLQIETQLRCEAEERARLKEEARQALEEKNRLEEQTRLAIEEQHRLEEQTRLAIEEQHRLEEETRLALEEQRRLEVQNARVILQREEQERLEQERIEREILRREAEEREREAYRAAEPQRTSREAETERAKAAIPEMGDGRYTYTSKAVKLIFRRSVDPNITTRIHEIIKATVDYYGKDNVSLKIRAMVTDSQTVVLEFTEIPLEEMSLLGNIVKILGNSGLGIAKAIIQ